MMVMMRFALLAAAAFFLQPVHDALAQSYPKGPINLVIPLASGDATDIAGRAMAEELSKLLKVPLVAINRPGAGGTVGTDSVVKAAKDGYTILLANNASLTFRRVLEPQNVTYDPQKDLTPLGLTTRIPTVVAVRPDAPYKTLGEMLETSKKNPGTVRLGNVGAGSVGDFTVQMINSLASARLTSVPFKGASPAIAALRGGHVEGVVVALGAIAGQFKGGAAHGVVISTKFPVFPGIPTMMELGYKQNIPGVWFGFFAPAGVPAEVTRALVPAVERAAKDPAIAVKLQTLGMVQDYGAPEKLMAEINEEYRSVSEIARRAGLIK
jgi:tripartite-type tricarboxylate transporter receptor subunit TctC